MMYSANGLYAKQDKITCFMPRPTIKALGEYIAKRNSKSGKQHIMYAVYKGRKFHGYYTLQGDKLSKQGTVRWSKYLAI